MPGSRGRRSALSRSVLVATLSGLWLTGCSSEPPPPSPPPQPPQDAAGPVVFAPETKRARLVVPEVVEEPVDVPELLREKGCDVCHAQSRTLLGPSYRAVAGAYGSNRDVMTEVLARKIINGGGGNWGLALMVPAPHVTPEEARQMAAWVLDLPP